MSETRRRWRVTRRGFLIGTGVVGGALALGVTVGLPEAQYRIAAALDGASQPADVETDPLLWFEVQPDNRVRLWMPKVEMGQGVHTALAQIAADELELAWEQVEIVQASSRRGPGDGGGTQGSSSVSGLYQPLRELAATLREMLRAEAAARLNVSADRLVARDGAFSVAGDAGQRVTYGELVEGKTEWATPEGEAALKAASDFRLIGQPIPRADLPGKVTGQAVYGYDARAEGMLYGAVARPPTLEATVRAVRNLPAVRAMAGVVAAVHEGDFVGVAARSRREAIAARDALEIAWTEGRRWQQAELDETVTVGGRGGVTIQREGDAPAALREGRVIQAEYRTPLAAHAPMEPQAALADVRADGASVWTSTQMQARTAEAVAKAIGLKAEQVEVTPTLLGGGFGRKGIVEVAAEAARLSRAAGAPVHVGWSREEELRHGYFRPPTHSLLRATLDGGRIAAIEHQQASGDVIFSFVPDFVGTLLGADFGAWRGATVPYAIAHRHTVAWRRKLPVPTGPWRGLGLLANVFAVESFVDELAHAAGADPLQFRLDHLPNTPLGNKLRGVLGAVARAGEWDSASPAGRARGLACCTDVGTAVAELAEVSLADDGTVRVHRVVAAMDCGLVINPDGARAQMEGNIVMGLSSTLREQAQVRDGRVDVGNFDTYPLLTMREAPDIEAILVDSGDAQPRGVGEPAIGPIAAAVANALFALTGTRVRELPLTAERVRAAVGRGHVA